LSPVAECRNPPGTRRRRAQPPHARAHGVGHPAPCPDGSGFHLELGVGLRPRPAEHHDLAGGAQPSTTKTDRLISYNGEVFNYVELRTHARTARPPLLHTYRPEVDRPPLRGTRDDFVRELNGSSRSPSGRPRRRLLLGARSHGHPALYYTRTARSAFRLRGEGPACERQDRRRTRSEWPRRDLHVLGAARPTTMFQGVSQVCPGEMVVLPGDRLQRRTWWHWNFPDAGSHRRHPNRN